MKSALFLTIAFFISFSGCARRDDHPQDAIVRFTDAINKQDTLMLKKAFASWVSNDNLTLPLIIDSLKPHFSTKILSIDSGGATVNILFSLTMIFELRKEKRDTTMDSLRAQVVRENGEWKISSIMVGNNHL